MLTLSRSVRIFVCLVPADMRRGFDGLARMVEEVVQADPFSGHLFVFRNRRADRLKALYWDRDGMALWYKRLERGTFGFPESDGEAAAISQAELAMILEGVEATGVRRRRRYERTGRNEEKISIADKPRAKR